MIRKLHYIELLLVIFWKADLKCDSGALQCLKTSVLSGLGVGAFTATVKVPRPGSLSLGNELIVIKNSFIKTDNVFTWQPLL